MPLSLLHRTLTAAGLDKRHRADRRVLEGVIFPWLLAQPQLQRVLFVGCAWYTVRYHARFAGKDYTTLEPEPRQARYGAPRHLVGRLEALDRLVAPASLDLIVCNGVVGWGLDCPAAVNTAFVACHRALRPGGVLLVGWNDTVRRNGRVLMLAPALLRFLPLVCPPLGRAQVETAGVSRHVFSFYQRP
jgi:SAM-dependent methyltransferase